MKKISSFGLGVALALGTAGGAAIVAAPAIAKEKAPTYKLTKEVQAALAEAQKLQQAGDLNGAAVKANEGVAAAKSGDDKFVAGQIMYGVAQARKDQAGLEQGTRLMLDSGKAPADLKRQLMQNLAVFAVQKKDYPGALKQFQALNTAYPNDPDITVSLAEMYQANKMTPQAVQTLQQAIDAKKATGQPVPESWYQRMLAVAYDAKRADLAVPASMSLISAYPSASNWRDSLIIFRDSARLDEQANLDLMRLMRAAGALKGESDYYEYANLAYLKGFPGEAQAVINEGIAARQLNPGKPTFAELSRLSSAKVAADKASLPKLSTQAKAGANGKLALATGDAYLGYGEYAKAAELYQVALAKGGIDANTANTRLGIAQGRAGNKAAADAALAKVTGEPRASLAKYWQAWLGKGA